MPAATQGSSWQIREWDNSHQYSSIAPKVMNCNDFAHILFLYKILLACYTMHLCCIFIRKTSRTNLSGWNKQPEKMEWTCDFFLILFFLFCATKSTVTQLKTEAPAFPFRTSGRCDEQWTHLLWPLLQLVCEYDVLRRCHFQGGV